MSIWSIDCTYTVVVFTHTSFPRLLLGHAINREKLKPRMLRIGRLSHAAKAVCKNSKGELRDISYDHNDDESRGPSLNSLIHIWCYVFVPLLPGHTQAATRCLSAKARGKYFDAVEVKNGVAVIRIDGPGKMNTIDDDFRAELEDLWMVRVLVLVVHSMPLCPS